MANQLDSSCVSGAAAGVGLQTQGFLCPRDSS